ncbi:MAG TPA: class I SAM-dependent methyltransferase [Gaiellaceae bacterium]|nr:class I SAM-dependent methyltransferase [Gaiellaceae bacterium]
MSADEASFVREQYATPDNLRARKAAYVNAEGEDPREFVLEAVAAAKPRRVLEVGGGEGELAERIVSRLDVELVGVDQSEGMVAEQRARGIDARVGDVQDLPFDEGEFDVAVAAWMLYHVPDLDRGLAELARVLKPEGVLVAVTNSVEHLQELWTLAERASAIGEFRFRSDNGAEVLHRHFAAVGRRDARGFVVMDDGTIRRFAASWRALGSLVRMPPLGEPLRVRRHSTVFVARKYHQAP